MQPVFKMQYISLFPKYRGAENSMPKLREVTGTKTKIYCQANICQTCSATGHQSNSDLSWKLGKTT